MKSMLEELKDVKIKKHTVTSIEYDCKSEEKEDAVFDQVHNIVTNHLDDFTKITFDVEAEIFREYETGCWMAAGNDQ